MVGGPIAAVPTVQSLALPGDPAGGPATLQPFIGSAPGSKEVLPSPVDTTMSSTKTPGSWTTSSLAYEMETSTFLFA